MPNKRKDQNNVGVQDNNTLPDLDNAQTIRTGMSGNPNEDTAKSQDGSTRPGKDNQPVKNKPTQDWSSGEPSAMTANQSSQLIIPGGESSIKKFNEVITTSPGKKSFNFNIVATMLGVVLLLAGVVSGVLLIQKPQSFMQRASKEQEKEAVSTYAACNEVRVYNEKWKLLSREQLNNLETGDKVYLTIKCSSTSGIFDVARFTINDEVKEKVTTKRPETNEFYYRYEIPREIKSFRIKAEVHHSELGWF